VAFGSFCQRIEAPMAWKWVAVLLFGFTLSIANSLYGFLPEGVNTVLYAAVLLGVIRLAGLGRWW
jgi:hypothetical protein